MCYFGSESYSGRLIRGSRVRVPPGSLSKKGNYISVVHNGDISSKMAKTNVSSNGLGTPRRDSRFESSCITNVGSNPSISSLLWTASI